MSKLAIILVFAAGLLTACGNKEKNHVDSSMLNNPASLKGDDNEAVPDIEFSNKEADFGKLIQGDMVAHTFKFTNTGEAPLIISQVSGSCGCTILKGYPKEPIEPGEGGSIKVEYNSTGMQGAQKAAITLATNARPSTRMLYLKSNIIAPEQK